MESDVAAALKDLGDRVSYQEHLHRDISLTPQGFIHGVLTNLPVIITAVGFSAIIAFVVVKYSK
jgi:hypothetical protein